MTLRVPFEEFSDAVRRHFSTREVYAQGDRAKTVVTASEPTSQMVIVASTKQSFEQVRMELEKRELKVSRGIWTLDDDHELLELPYIAAISYRANKQKTGVWVGAYESEPNEVQVFQEMYEEFKQSGEMAEISFDSFVESAQLTSVILSPNAIEEITVKKEN
jgi:exo-beta-1,3-glucanase (GH17 family)